MKKLDWLFIILICSGIFNSCKDFDINPNELENSFRIKTIIEQDHFGKELSRELFFYENNRLVFLKLYTTENDELTENRKVIISYKGDNATATMFLLKNDYWTVRQECSFTISNNLLMEKSVSRLYWPECKNCWKYTYKYEGTKLVEWVKWIKTQNEEWSENRKVEFIYENNKLAVYKDYENFDNSILKLDYQKKYAVNADKVSGWEGGICVDGCDWKPTEKVDYLYDGDNIVLKTYSIRDISSNEWKYFGAVNYTYNEYDCLVEVVTSSGNRTIYEYERGAGNAALIYCTPEDNAENEPDWKSATIVADIFQ